MAKKGAGEVRVVVNMACEACKHKNYSTTKNKRNTQERLQLKKYCRWCRIHTAHKETK